MSTAQNAREIQDVANYSSRLGTLAWWDLSDTQIEPGHLRAVLAAEKIDVVVPEIDAVSGLRRACTNWSSGRGNSDRYRAEIVSIEETPNSNPTIPGHAITVFVGILTHSVDRAGRENAWRQVERLEFDAMARVWRTAPSEMARPFVAIADGMMRFHDHRWIRRNVILPELAAMAACDMRRQGGIYFVPAASTERLRHLKRAIKAIGNSDLFLAAVEHDEDSRESVARGASSSLMDEVDVLAAKIDEWTTSKSAPRKNAHANVIAELADLAARADLYEGVLSMRLDEFRARRDAVNAAAIALITAPAPAE